MNALLSVAPVRMWEMQDWFIFVIVIAAACAVVYFILQAMEVRIPPIVLRIIGIILLAVLGVFAIRFLFSI